MKRKAKISDEQRQAIKEENNGPVDLVDIESNDRYVLMRAQDYERVRALFETDEFDISETYTAQSESLKDVWDDPALDAYNQ